MYNNLNSLLIEGKVQDDAYMSAGMLTFTLASKRLYREEASDENDISSETTFIEVRADGSLKNNLHKRLVKDRDVRVVGRIAMHSTGNIFVVAEHVEVRSERN